MNWLSAAGGGALGGVVVEAVVFYGRLSAWQSARHKALAQNKRRLPPIGRYFDPPADIAASATRVLLGALAGLLFHSDVTDTYAAIAVGASAPGLLRHLGSARSIHDIIQGGDGPDAASPAIAATAGDSPAADPSGA